MNNKVKPKPVLKSFDLDLDSSTMTFPTQNICIWLAPLI